MWGDEYTLPSWMSEPDGPTDEEVLSAEDHFDRLVALAEELANEIRAVRKLLGVSPDNGLFNYGRSNLPAVLRDVDRQVRDE